MQCSEVRFWIVGLNFFTLLTIQITALSITTKHAVSWELRKTWWEARWIFHPLRHKWIHPKERSVLTLESLFLLCFKRDKAWNLKTISTSISTSYNAHILKTILYGLFYFLSQCDPVSAGRHISSFNHDLGVQMEAHTFKRLSYNSSSKRIVISNSLVKVNWSIVE